MTTSNDHFDLTGVELDEITADAYQLYQGHVNGFKDFSRDSICLCTLGLAGESGEVADLIKKHYGHGKSIELDELILELGDVMWYLSQLSRLLGFTMTEVMTMNMQKLHNRHPGGFKRDDELNKEQP